MSSEFKAKIALEALKEKNSLGELAKKYEVHQPQISTWKKEANEKLSQVFDKPKQGTSVDMEKQLEKLYAQIGQLKVENDLKKEDYEQAGERTNTIGRKRAKELEYGDPMSFIEHSSKWFVLQGSRRK